MGNQEIRSAMASVQSREFNAQELDEYEALLWREQSRDLLSGFDGHMKMDGVTWEGLMPNHAKLSVEKSGIDDDQKRYQNEAKECWQAGFSNSEKILETLKNGDYKQIVIPTNQNAASFEGAMQLKVMILSALFFVRHQGGSEAMDDFFTFARKHVEQQQQVDFVYRSELTSLQLLDEEARGYLATRGLATFKNVVARLLHSTLRVEPQRMFSQEASSFSDDLSHMQMRRILLTVLGKTDDGEARSLIVRLLLRWGVIRASSEDLLLAAQLQQKYNLDLSSDLEFLCKQSEVWTKPVFSQGGNDFSRNDQGHIQSRVGFTRGSDRAHEQDQVCTDGSKYFIHSNDRGLSRGSKKPKTGEWECQLQVDQTYSEMTMLCHKGQLLIRYREAPNQPFVIFSKETLQPALGETPYRVAEGEEDYLKWTPLETQYEENAQVGNRWHRASPMFSDGENIYMLVEYKKSNFTSEIVRTVLEVYEVDEERCMKRINEVVLYKNSQMEYYRGCKSKQKDHGGHLARGSIACNQDVLLWWSSHNFHVYEYATGIRKKKEHVNSTSYITFYDAKENWYYFMDAACYSWLKRCKISGFKPRVLTKSEKELPDLPILLDGLKGEILAQIKEENKLEEKEDDSEETKHKRRQDEEKKKQPRNDLFHLLAVQDDEELAHWKVPELHKAPRTTEPIANITEVTQAIILSKMGCEAMSASFKVKSMGDKKLLNEEMLPYFKSPFAISCSKSYFILIRQALEEELAKLNDGKITTMKQANVLNLVRVLQANIDCLTAIRVEMKQILPESELKAIYLLQSTKLEEIQLFQGQNDKKDEDLSETEIFQLHIYQAAQKLIQTIESNLDAETRQEKLKNFEKNLKAAIQDEEGPASKVLKRVVPLMSSKKALKDLFDGDESDLMLSRTVATKCATYLKDKICQAVRSGIENKVFSHREMGMLKVIRNFTKAFCQELMVSYGNQLLTILEKSNVKREGELSKEEQVQLETLMDAESRKKALEPMLYETFISISEIFKELIQDITRQVKEAKVYEWQEKEKIKQFFDFIAGLYLANESIPKIILQFCMMMCAHKPEVTWLDEISEALKNCAEGLNSYLVMYNNLPYQHQIRLKSVDKYRQLVDESLRTICYSIGALAYRLSLVSSEESEDSRALSKLNILQGGIEARFIPSLSQETKAQIEGSFKITNDKQLQQLALSGEDKVVLEASDSLIQGVIDAEKSQAKIELVIKVLQQGLRTKQPMCPFANLGADTGMKLARAAFGTMLKFCDKLELFLKLAEDVDFTSKDIGDDEVGDMKVKSIVNTLKNQANDGFFEMLKLWEQAAQMRKWISNIKKTQSELIESKVMEELRREISEQNPSKEPFTGEFDEEQKQTIRARSDEKFDKEMPLKYQEVIRKADFLVQLAIPAAFRQVKKEAIMSGMAQGLENKLGMALMRNHSTGGAANLLGRGQSSPEGLKKSTTSVRRGSVSSDGKVKGMSSGMQRRKTVLLNEGEVNKKDSEYDWRDRMKQWKQRQQTSGSVTNFQDQIKLQNQSAVFSVLGCLQADFKCEKLQERVEQSLVNGLRRSAGLHLLNFAMNLSFSQHRFFDLLQWFQGSLRSNRIQTVHYLTGLDGCGIKAETGIRIQFFQILDKVVHVLKHEQLSTSTEYVHLLNALCWNYAREDHDYLVSMNILKVVQCGDGTLMHPILRSWGQEDSNFQLELEREGSLCLTSRLRQVFEFLVQTILESLFVKRDQEKLELGGAETQEQMVALSAVGSQKASESLLHSICSILFANTNRYLRMKELFQKDFFEGKEDPKRFEEPKSEDDDAFNVESRCPRDLANYINEKGGYRLLMAARKLDFFLDEMKAQMFIAKVESTGAEGIQSEQQLSDQIRKIASSCLTGAERSLSSTAQLICNRDYRTISAIKACSWEELGLKKPQLSMEEKAEGTGIPLEEYRQICVLTEKLRQIESKKLDQQEDAEENIDNEEEDEADEPTKPPTMTLISWNCSACTFKNTSSHRVCEICSTPRVSEIATPKTIETAVSATGTVNEEAKAASPEQPATEEAATEEQKSAETTAEAATEQTQSEETKEEVKQEEEKKEQKTEAQRQAEEEKLIVEEKDEKARCNRYLNFLLTAKNFDDASAAAQESEIVKIEGNMYTETSLFRIIKLLDQLSTLSNVSEEGYQIVQRISDPENLRHIIELSVEASPENQIVIMRILQTILRLGLPQEVLDLAVKLAKQQDDLKAKPNKVARLLLKNSALCIEKSLFLKFLFNRLENSRRALNKASKAEKPGLNSVLNEIVRTVRVLFTDSEQNQSLRKIIFEAVTDSLMQIQDMSEGQIEAIMSLVPEAAFQRMAIGTPCVNKDGKIFNIVGVLHSNQENNPYQNVPLRLNYSQENTALSLAGLYYDPENPERQDFMIEKMIYSKPLLDLDEQDTAEAARQSIFMDPAALEQLLEIAMQEESSFEQPAAKRAMSLLQTYIVRGLFNMIQTLKSDFIEHLRAFDLLHSFFKFLFDIANQLSASPEELLVSTLLLELRADYLREMAMTSAEKCFSEEKAGGASIMISDDGQQLYVYRAKEPVDMFYFTTQLQFGPDEGKSFEGPLHESNPVQNQNGFFVVPSSRLVEPTEATMQILKAASILITDSGLDTSQFLKTLKKKMLQDTDRWRNCSQTRFILLKRPDDVKKIQSIMQSGSSEKNTDIMDRAFFLGSSLKHIDSAIWDKVDKEVYMRKFAHIGVDMSYEEVCTVWGPQLLAEQIEAKFSEAESFPHQISMGETFQKIREGEFITQDMAKEETSGEAITAPSLQKQLSAKLQQEVEETKESPNFGSIILSGEKLASYVSENFFKAEAPSKLDTDFFSEQFKNSIFNAEGTGINEISKTYHSLVSTLRQNYSRTILLNILQNGSESLDDESKELLSSGGSFAKVCDIIHIDFMIGSHVNQFFGNPQMLEQSKQQISALLRFMGSIDGFKQYFLKDLQQRAKHTLEQASANNFDQLDKFKLKTLRKAMEGKPLLDPLNLLFLGDQVFELGFVSETDEAELCTLTKQMFDLCMAYSLVFTHETEFYINLDLLKMAKKLLGKLDAHLPALAENHEAILKDLFSSKLIQPLTINMSVNGCEKLNDRQKLVLEMIIRIVKIQRRYNEQFNKNAEVGFEISDSVQKALQVFRTIEQGKSFTQFMEAQKLQALLSSSDAHKIAHLAKNYRTDERKYNIKFSKKVTATEQDLVIRIDDYSSTDLMQIKSESAQLITDVGGFKSGRELFIKVPKGQSAQIDFPVFPQLASFSGKIFDHRFANWNLESDVLKTIDESSQCAAVNVVAMHNSVMFVGGDESIWGMGMRTQGRNGDDPKLRRIEAPESMRNFKKIAHGKFFRLVLTQENRLFINGESRRYMMGSGTDRQRYVQKFEEFPDNYFRMEAGDKIVDCCGGKNFVAVVTEQGKIFAAGYIFYRNFQGCRSNPENNEDYPFEIRMPQGFKAKEIWGSEKSNNIWVNATNQDGELKTMAAGGNNQLLGHGQENRPDIFTPVKLPDNTYLTKVASEGSLVHGVDNIGNLWVWGGEIYAESTDDFQNLYEGEYTRDSLPKKMKWFQEQNLKVLDVECGRESALVKCEDKDGKIIFYGLCRDEDSICKIGGLGRTSRAYKHFINMLDVDGDRVEAFAMSQQASFMLIRPKKQVTTSVDPDHPEESGLIHFYQDGADQSWKFVTPEQYEVKKNELPAVCFATRHPMVSFLERVKRQRANEATDEDRNNTDLPSLATLAPQLQYDDSNVEDVPSYYARHVIDEREQVFTASEAQALAGDQAHEMNPIIYYRTTKSLDSTEPLPVIDLEKFFTRAEKKDHASFTIMQEKINEKEIQEIEICDPVVLERFETIRNFTQEQDLELLKFIDDQIILRKCKVEDASAKMVFIEKSNLRSDSSLQSMDERAIQIRNEMLFEFSKAFSICFKYISVEERDIPGTISYHHFRSKSMIISSVINGIVDKQLADLPGGGTPNITINRRKAFEYADQGNCDNEGKYSIFGQICQELRQNCPDFSCFRHSDVDGRAYKVTFKGEGSIDVGGPFRDTLVNIVNEMEEGALPLLIKSPNNRNDHGSYRDCFILNPSATSPAHLEMFRFMGGFLAFAILSKSPIPFNLAPTIWKQLLGEKLKLSDLESIDAYSSQVLIDLRDHGASLSDEDFEAGVEQNFSTVLSNGDEVVLCEGGEERRVTKNSIEEFISLVLDKRFSEGTQQIKAIQEGIDKVFEGKLGMISYLTAESVEVRACGSKEVSVERLKSITSYNNCSDSHEVVQRFWRVFESLSHAQRRNYLKFVWGRNRLPVDLSKLSRKHEVRLFDNMNESGFPIAHTCFFQLDIPFYRTDEMMRTRLIQASELCGSVDTDNNNFAED